MALNLWQCNFFVIWSNFEKVRNFLVLLLQTFQRQHIKILPHSDNCHCINFSLLFGINWCRTVRNFDYFFTQTTLRFISSLKKREQQLLPIHSKKCHVLNLDGNYYASSVITLLRGEGGLLKGQISQFWLHNIFFPLCFQSRHFYQRGKWRVRIFLSLTQFYDFEEAEVLQSNDPRILLLSLEFWVL